MSKLISISLSPNVQGEDLAATKKALRDKQHYQTGEHTAEFEKEFAALFGVKKDLVASVNSGRSALLGLLHAFGIGKGDEVALQAFTCNAVPNPVLWLGAKPLYIDVDEHTLNMDPESLVNRITPRTKALIIQHSFGLPAPMDELMQIARKHKLIVIEDCAHALGATYKGKLTGTFGDAAFFSFGRDKVISCVYGGMALFARATPEVKGRFLQWHQALPYPSEHWVTQQLRHPLTMRTLLPYYNRPFANYGIGKFLLQLSQATSYLSKAVHWKEKQGQKPDYFPARLPNALAWLALVQFRRLATFNDHRKKLADFYMGRLGEGYIPQAATAGRIYLRFPVRHPRAHQCIAKARKSGMLLGDWYSSVIAPDDTDLTKMRYHQGSCPVAEMVSRETLNLPTNPNLSLQDAKRVVEFLEIHSRG